MTEWMEVYDFWDVSDKRTTFCASKNISFLFKTNSICFLLQRLLEINWTVCFHSNPQFTNLAMLCCSATKQNKLPCVMPKEDVGDL